MHVGVHTRTHTHVFIDVTAFFFFKSQSCVCVCVCVCVQIKLLVHVVLIFCPSDSAFLSLYTRCQEELWLKAVLLIEMQRGENVRTCLATPSLSELPQCSIATLLPFKKVKGACDFGRVECVFSSQHVSAWLQKPASFSRLLCLATVVKKWRNLNNWNDCRERERLEIKTTSLLKCPHPPKKKKKSSPRMNKLSPRMNKLCSVLLHPLLPLSFCSRYILVSASFYV